MNKEPRINIVDGLVAIDRDGIVLHFCGYPQKATEFDIRDLERELLEDGEFGLTHEEFVVVRASEKIIEIYKEIYEQMEN
jgi:hypothetical protein